MEPTGRQLLDALERSLRFELEAGDVTAMGATHDTGWRTLPGCTTAHILDTELAIEYDGAATTRIRHGECVCLPPGLRHRSSSVGGPGISRWSLFSCRVFGSIDVMSLFALPRVLVGAAAARIGDLSAELAAAQRGDGGALRIGVRLHALGFQLVDALIGDAPLLPHSQALLLHAERLAPVLDHIERRLAAPLTRVGLARVAGLSPSRFHALFRAAVGMAPLSYVLQRRLQRAQQLLIASDLGVATIAESVGFADAFYFSRLFRLRLGTTPSEYRDAARRGFAADRARD